MLEIKDLSISFQRYSSFFRQEKITRLSNINFKLAQGEILTVIGHSGAGKSLLAHAILNLLPKNALIDGQIFLNNQRLNEKALKEVRGRKIALLPQQISYLDPTARIGAQIKWAAKRAKAEKQVSQRLEAIGLEKKVSKLYPHQLSGGMARRVLMAQATAGNAKVLIADEPTTGLDPQTRDNILDQLRHYADNGGAVLLITHDLIPALSRADRVAVLNDGKMCCIVSPSAFSGHGEALPSGYVQKLWRALPQNEFYNYA